MTKINTLKRNKANAMEKAPDRKLKLATSSQKVLH